MDSGSSKLAAVMSRRCERYHWSTILKSMCALFTKDDPLRRLCPTSPLLCASVSLCLCVSVVRFPVFEEGITTETQRHREEGYKTSGEQGTQFGQSTSS